MCKFGYFVCIPKPKEIIPNELSDLFMQIDFQYEVDQISNISEIFPKLLSNKPYSW